MQCITMRLPQLGHVYWSSLDYEHGFVDFVKGQERQRFCDMGLIDNNHIFNIDQRFTRKNNLEHIAIEHL